MVRRLNLLFLKVACRVAMRRPAPDRISRSLPGAFGIDCFSLTFSGQDNEWSILVDTVSPEGVVGRWLDAGAYSSAVGMAWNTVLDSKLDCSHYIGVHEFQYGSPLQLVLREVLLLPRFEVIRDRFKQD